MPKLTEFAAQAGLVIFAQALAMMLSTAAYSDADLPAVPVASQIDNPFAAEPMVDFADTIEIPGTLVAGKLTHRLVPNDPILLAQSQRPAKGENGRRGPPKEAIAACAQKTEDMVCSFAGRDSTAIEGTCKAGPRGEAPACMPAGGKPGGERPSQSERG
ncbi:hypothetical protein N9H93_01485 [Rhizobiaceae bacterium]|nr:hypothetical protein [Rhizobiaceae bacterium]